jgi:hypothetical protein
MSEDTRALPQNWHDPTAWDRFYRSFRRPWGVMPLAAGIESRAHLPSLRCQRRRSASHAVVKVGQPAMRVLLMMEKPRTRDGGEPGAW